MDISDARFRDRLIDEVTSVVMATHISFCKASERKLSEFRTSVPVFVCGGGARLRFYQTSLSALRDRLANLLDWERRGAPGLVKKRMITPDALIAPGLEDDEVDRFCVAYGLSFDYRNLPDLKVGDLRKELKDAQDGKGRWHDTDSVEELTKKLERLMNPPIPPNDELRKIELVRPVTFLKVRQSVLYRDLPEAVVRRCYQNRLECAIRDDTIVPDETLVEAFRAARSRPVFKLI